MTQPQRVMVRGMLLLMWMFVEVSILGGGYVESAGEGEGIGVGVLEEKVWMKRAKGIRRCLRLWLL